MMTTTDRALSNIAACLISMTIALWLTVFLLAEYLDDVSFRLNLTAVLLRRLAPPPSLDGVVRPHPASVEVAANPSPATAPERKGSETVTR